MGSDTAVVASCSSVRSGEEDEALRLAEEALRAALVTWQTAKPACIRRIGHPRAQQRDPRFPRLMRRSAEREGNQGWRSCALSGRAFRLLQLGDQLADRDANAALQDLVDAEISLAAGVDDNVILERAHNGVGQGYHALRLYELALPQCSQQRFELVTSSPGSAATSSGFCCQVPDPTRRTWWPTGWPRPSMPSKGAPSRSASASPTVPAQLSSTLSTLLTWPCTSPSEQAETRPPFTRRRSDPAAERRYPRASRG